MNEIFNNFLFTGDKFRTELHLRQKNLLIALVDCLLNIAKGFKNLKKQMI